MRPLISILVPAYQAEKTIRRCLLSIFNQTNSDFEVIVIDDGSSDQTFSICQDFKTDKKFRLYTQSNIGISATRKKLLEYAEGEYIQFVDADDWIEPNTIDVLKTCIESHNPEIVITDFVAVYPQKSEYTLQRPSGFDSTHLISDISSSRMLGVLWNKLIKKELLAGVVIPKLNYCEDWAVSLQLFEKAKNVHYLNRAFYHYDNSFIGNSLTRNISKRTFVSRIEYIEYLKSLNFDKKFPIEYNSQVSSIAYAAIIHGIYTEEEFKIVFSGVSLIRNNIPLYQKFIIILSQTFSHAFAKSVDALLRKVFRR